MTVIADTSPLQYAVEIGVAHTLFMLYGRIVVPVAVSSEMRHPGPAVAGDRYGSPQMQMLDSER